MLEIEALIELLVEKGIVTKEEVMAKCKKLDREMKEKIECPFLNGQLLFHRGKNGDGESFAN